MNKNIPFIDLQAQQKRIRKDIEKRIMTVLDHGKYIMGPEVHELEEKLAEYCGVKHAISCASGTDALLIPLMAYDIGPGDAVITTPFTFISTAEVVALLGATPVFVDIDPRTYNIDPAAVAAVLKSGELEKQGLKARGIIPVDLFGQLANYPELENIARAHDLFVLEDAAQAFGAEYAGKKAGCFGDVASTSFFPAKPLGAYGDGGAIFTDNDELAEKMRSVRIHGKGSDKYNNIRLGINGRCDSLQAAVVLAKLTIFDEEVGLRNQVAEYYTRNMPESILAPHVADGHTSSWAQYTLQVDNRAARQAVLKEKQVPTAIYYPKPLHLQDAFKRYGGHEGQFPVTEAISHRVFSIPMHPYLQREDQDYILEALNS